MVAEKLRLEDYIEEGLNKEVVDYIINIMSTNRSNIAFLGREEVLQEIKDLEETLYDEILNFNEDYKWLSSGVAFGGIKDYLKRDLVDILSLTKKGLLPTRFLDGLESNWRQHLKGKGICVFFEKQDGKLVCTNIYDCTALNGTQIGYIYSQEEGFNANRKIPMGVVDLQEA